MQRLKLKLIASVNQIQSLSLVAENIGNRHNEVVGSPNIDAVNGEGLTVSAGYLI